MLNKFIKLTGYQRSYAARVLRRKEVLGYLSIVGQNIKYVPSGRKRKKVKYYDQEVLIKLKEIWKVCDYICS